VTRHAKHSNIAVTVPTQPTAVPATDDPKMVDSPSPATLLSYITTEMDSRDTAAKTAPVTHPLDELAMYFM